MRPRTNKIMGCSSSWVFKLTITNATGEDLDVSSSTLSWGHWYRTGCSGKGPIGVKAGETVEALGICASSGTATGYECDCTWKGKCGTVSLVIDVPYSKSNHVSFQVGGVYEQSGWSNIGSSGHHFTESVTITKKSV